MGKKRRNNRSSLCAVYADHTGKVWDLPGREPAFRTGRRFVAANANELIPLPYGSVLFTLPARMPVFRDSSGTFRTLNDDTGATQYTAVSAFLASGYLRTYLPAFVQQPDAPVLPMWAYAGVAFANDQFMVPGIRIDEDPRSDPAIHENDEELAEAIAAETAVLPGNRLVRQLAMCSTSYRCLCARNYFLGRYEAPIPTTPACNADCVGCLSLQPDGSPFPASQPRLEFSPSPQEIADVIIRHFERVDRAVASFGQGCEGEPILRAKDLAAAIRLVRKTTARGTINLNTNGSLPDAVRLLADAGLDSIRVSLNSPTEEYYLRYHRPKGYGFTDVCSSIQVAVSAGLFVSINLFFMPGFTDMLTEVESLFSFLERYPVNMIQTRNMNIDPDYYFDRIGFRESDTIGIATLVERIRERFPHIRIGYYNPPLRE